MDNWEGLNGGGGGSTRRRTSMKMNVCRYLRDIFESNISSWIIFH